MSKRYPVRMIILLGSNLGHRQDNILRATQELERRMGPIVMESDLYESKALGFESDHDFLNKALVLDTHLPPGRAMQTMLKTEKKLGRIRSDEVISRSIDIDMLFYGGRNISQKKLIIPHPRLHLRRFALIPLCQIVPNYIHPKLGVSLKTLLRDCPDQSNVVVFETK